MFLAVVICSDPDCSAELEIEATSIEELQAYVCGCGYAMELVGWPDWVDEQALIVGLPDPPRDRSDLVEAA